MTNLPSDFKAVVFGASGAIGRAFVEAISEVPDCSQVIGVSRQTHPDFDFEREETIADVACAWSDAMPFFLANGFRPICLGETASHYPRQLWKPVRARWHDEAMLRAPTAA